MLDTIPEQLGRSVHFAIFTNFVKFVNFAFFNNFVACAPTVWAMISAVLEPLNNTMNVKSVITLKQSTRLFISICLLSVTWIDQANSTHRHFVNVYTVTRHFSCNWGPAQIRITCLFYIYCNIFISLVKKVEKFEYPYKYMFFLSECSKFHKRFISIILCTFIQ